MEKAGLKTFVYSFVFSLFTLFSVNGVYLRSLKNHSPEAKIPSKNITLFLKDISSNGTRAQAVPTKKIALSVLPELSPKENLSEQIPLSDDTWDEPTPIRQFVSADIPLQSTFIPPKNQSDQQIGDTEKIISNFEQVIKSRPAIENAPEVKQNTSDVPDEQTAPLQSPVTPHISEDATQIAMNVIFTSEKEQHQVAQTPQPDTDAFVEKPQTLREDISDAQQSHPLIPLEKEAVSSRLAQNEVKTTADIKDNQVALNAHNIPIKSMLNNTPSKEETPKTDGEWQSMAEKAQPNSEESPWVVAKGGKFPRNEMILQDTAYKQDEAEINRILSANTPDAKSNSGKGTVKLASETAKNLLIPIPEEIMKEKNITPQLVSSAKNQTAEEELAEKEALHEDIKREQEEQSQSSAPNEKKSSILNSLTSIFSSKKNTPQIGNSVNEPQENQNSLLSAFTRKPDRHITKILPTEIRLSFQPNRAEISGQTLKWIRAFAQKTAEEAATGLEIRIDGTSSPLLQRRRLNLLQNILMNEGADQSKIKTVFTAREPNSFILRTIRMNNENIDIPQNRNIRAKNNYMQW